MTDKTKKILKITGKSVLGVVLALLVIVCGYAIYFVSAFNRIGDTSLTVNKGDTTDAGINTNQTYNLLSWNVGFCAYSDDYSFFMDGGTESRAFSKKAVEDNLNGITNTYLKIKKDKNLMKNDFDFICYQEVDFDSTRSYRVDIKEELKKSHLGYSSTFAQNYDSPYIMIPLTSPHGANNSGLLTLSKYRIQSAQRKELPLEDSLAKYVDLDRCLSINRIKVDNNKELVLVNIHLSGYSSDGAINITQLKLLLDICKAEYEKGNYVICAGDFNMDLVDGEGSAGLFGNNSKGENWAQPIDPAIFEGTGMVKHAPVDKANPVPTCRNAIRPYSEGNSVYIIDGFLASQNVLVLEKSVYDAGFKNSDHNPVILTFRLER